MLWSVIGAGTLLMRLLLSFARFQENRPDPGVYRCMTCGRSCVTLG